MADSLPAPRGGRNGGAAMSLSPGVRLLVWGERACFTRPEMKVERVSYDVMTPSAARGILEHIVPYGLYRVHGFVNAKLAERTGFSQADLDLLWTGLRDMFDLDRSAARGMMAARRLIAFRHECALGNAQAHKLFERITVHRLHHGEEAAPGNLRTHNWPPATASTLTAMLCRRASPCMNPSDDSLPISALQHWLFCPRQCALIHVERVWAENRFTAEGRLLHERADDGRPETRDGVRTLRAVQIGSVRHGLHGVADVVEMRGGDPYPVEYKRGRPKAHRADEVQLCAQALCLEEMTGRAIREGALFYGRNRRRKTVLIDAGLRELTMDLARQARAAIDTGEIPAPVYDRDRCDACSLHEFCRPRGCRVLGRDWLSRRISRAGVPE